MGESERRQMEDLQARYLRAIDDDRLEEWPELFTETCLYRIVSRENFEQGLPLAVMECHSRGMLQDRVTGLRKINVFEPQRYSHQQSGLVVERMEDGWARCRSNFLVVRTMGTGAMTVFACGVYLDRIVWEGESPRFAERVAVLDSRRIETLLVIPL